jgi:hypothetical protein
MTPNPSLWSQLSGPVVQSVIQGIQNALNEDLPLINYWGTLSLLTAQDVDGTLDYVGSLAGYPRPLVSNIFFGNTQPFLFTDVSLYPFNSVPDGFSDAATWTATPYQPVANPGGFLDTALPPASNIMPVAYYQQLIPIFAQIRYSGLSLAGVDALAAWCNTNGGGTGYTITRDQYMNIWVTFNTFVAITCLEIVNMIVAVLETLPLVVFQEP